MDMLNRAAENLQNEGWDEEAAAVREAADKIERLRKENQRQREHIMLLYSMIQTEHNIIRAVELKEGE